MPKFFRTNRMSTPSLLRHTQRMFSTHTREFSLANMPNQCGKLVKILFSDASNSTASLHKQIIATHRKSLFIGTTPTTRLKNLYMNGVYPGHNFSFITNDQGEVVCSMSKRPNTQKIVGEQKRVPDSRFKDLIQTMRIFLPNFTSVEEDLKIWMEKAKSVPEYPLFFHIIPLKPGLAINEKDYCANVDYLLAEKANYSLHSTLHPLYEHYIPANNCNSATEQAIFGPSTRSVHDMFCQEAAMEMVLRFVHDKKQYLQTSDSLGLTQGIESPEIAAENYRPLFTG